MPSGQSLLWVNHDAKNMNALPHRHRVFTHVQKSYRPWKRGQEVKSLRASAKVPILAKQRNRKDGRDQCFSSPRTNHSSEESESPGSDTWEGGPKALSLSTAIGKGNSDPFGAYPIPITAEVNNLMTFYRDYIIPSIWYRNFKNKNTMTLAAREWQFNVSHLEDEGTAYAIVARHGMVAAKCVSSPPERAMLLREEYSHWVPFVSEWADRYPQNPELRKLALQYVGKSTRALRGKVAQGHNLHQSSSSSIINNTAMLFNAETLGRNLVAATAHGKMLTFLFSEQWVQGKVDYRLLMYEIYNDCQLTSMFLCPPVFDVHHWLPMVFNPIWSNATRQLPQFAFEGLDPSVDSEELQFWFKSRQEQLQIYGQRNAEGNLFLDVPVVMTWFLSKAYIFHGRMINHYLRSKEQFLCPDLKREIKDHLFAQQFMALAAIYLTRGPNFNFNPTVLGIPMFDGAIIAHTLRALLEHSEVSSQRPSWKKYINARLWAFYVGALPEQANASKEFIPEAQWFTVHLVRLASTLGIVSWHTLRQILRAFLYSDILMAQGSEWFETLMATHFEHGS
ncbi:uncharacterized protein A1O5_06738 [Cladophialophora psammophila CBS 110553]|uniref:Transcription factor domain-containing protein n=1 Tax=Cladophialophora psammophila CBS 110553 TaxID=1182543 RepID=W9WN90_9EURO|nr:uncharacterized protein A1O5_06738 [Cladophialophora psammophila CBS 110553]EXJ69667.1 hypothetical protein A1O5_06738 [Cladophialophora psammophila CBS 110553]